MMRDHPAHMCAIPNKSVKLELRVQDRRIVANMHEYQGKYNKYIGHAHRSKSCCTRGFTVGTMTG